MVWRVRDMQHIFCGGKRWGGRRIWQIVELKRLGAIVLRVRHCREIALLLVVSVACEGVLVFVLLLL